MKLFIVESPTKCKTIKKYLGNEYTITASVGHIRAIPPRGLNVDIKNDFAPTFEVSSDKKKVVKEIKSLAKKADEIFLATDDDREGEAIAWHIYDILDKTSQKKCKRITYKEVTKKGITDALKDPRSINIDKVDAQKARQVLDRLIGYKVSPVLWRAVAPKTSAGRVQSIALRLVCDRQKKIDAFKPESFWYIDALLQSVKDEDKEFMARVVTKDKDNRYTQEKLSKDDADKLKKATYVLNKIDRAEKKVKAYPPFDTNSLQSECGSVFSWKLTKSKTLAQKLYEKGLVTYIRTDSFAISDEAIKEVRGLIKKATTSEYLPAKSNIYKKKTKSAKTAQEAHECIRPTDVYNKGDNISDPGEKKMYKLIRDRFIACQMTPMIVDTLAYHVKSSTKHMLIAKGQTVKFDGWSKIYKYTKTKETLLPAITKGTNLNLKNLKRTKHSTKPPARYNEVSLGNKMEKEGVGRPSTRTTIIESIQKKGYVESEKGKGKKGLVATELGLKISDYLIPHFSDFIMDIKYTSQLEMALDLIEDGKKTFLEVVTDVYEFLKSHIKEAGEDMPKKKVENMGKKCPVCKKGDILKREGRYGEFYGCGNYPKCKTIFFMDDDGNLNPKKKSVVKKTGKKCPECDKEGRKGELLERKSRKDGNVFLGCSLWPKCKHTESKD